MDENLARHAILAFECGGKIVDHFARHDPAPELVEQIAIDKKIGELMADVLVRGISEQAKLAGVGPQDPRVGANLMETFGGVLKKIGELFLAKRERFFSFLASRLLALEHLRLVLQVGDGAKPLVGIREFGITL